MSVISLSGGSPLQNRSVRTRSGLSRGGIPAGAPRTVESLRRASGLSLRGGGGQVSFVGGGITGSGGGGQSDLTRQLIAQRTGGGRRIGGLTPGGGVGSAVPGQAVSFSAAPGTRQVTPRENPLAGQFSQLLEQLTALQGQQGGNVQARNQLALELAQGGGNIFNRNIDEARSIAGRAREQSQREVANIGEAARRRTLDDAARQQAATLQALQSRGLTGSTALAGVQRGVAADAQRRQQEIDEQQALLRLGVINDARDAQTNLLQTQAQGNLTGNQFNAQLLQGQRDPVDQNVLLQLISQLSAASGGR